MEFWFIFWGWVCGWLCDVCLVLYLYDNKRFIYKIELDRYFNESEIKRYVKLDEYVKRLDSEKVNLGFKDGWKEK
jgi:hypothetical protein